MQIDLGPHNYLQIIYLMPNLSAAQLALAVLFTTTAFITLCGFLTSLSEPNKLKSTPFQLARKSLSNKIAAPLDHHNAQSIYLLLIYLSELGLVLFYVYTMENHPPHHHGEKSYDRDVFFLLTGMLFVGAAFTIKPNGGLVAKKMISSSSPSASASPPLTHHNLQPADSTVLNRYQTEEWKGECLISCFEVWKLLFPLHSA